MITNQPKNRIIEPELKLARMLKSEERRAMRFGEFLDSIGRKA